MKPENIVLEDSQPGGRLYLVDFGGVQARLQTWATVLQISWPCNVCNEGRALSGERMRRRASSNMLCIKGTYVLGL